MTRDTGSPAIPGRAFPECLRPASRATHSLPPSLSRCADAARARGEPSRQARAATAGISCWKCPAPGGLGPGRAALGRARVARSLASAAAAANANVLLIRRPGRQRPAAPGAEAREAPASVPRAMGLADTAPEAERVLWGSWDTPDDLLRLDLAAALPVTAAASGPQRVALVCTNGKRDQCCATARPSGRRGRSPRSPAGTAGSPRTWAGTVSRRPSCCCRPGDMFGWLDQQTAVAAVERFDAGQLLLSHYRGRSGQPVPAQAALHAAAVRLGDSAQARVPAGRAVQAGAHAPSQMTPNAGKSWSVHRAERGTEVTYRVTVARGTPSPALLSCSDESPQGRGPLRGALGYPRRAVRAG